MLQNWHEKSNEFALSARLYCFAIQQELVMAKEDKHEATRDKSSAKVKTSPASSSETWSPMNEPGE